MSMSRCTKCGEIFDTDEELETDKDGNYICDDCYARIKSEGGANA